MASLLPHTGVLGIKMARHLVRRASFHYTKTFIDQVALLTPSQALDLLFQNQAFTLALPSDPSEADPNKYWTESTAAANTFQNQVRKANNVAAWWWYNAINSPTIKYKMSHFLSTRFTVEKNNGVATATEFYDHIRLLLFYAYGNYKTLAKKITLDNSMLNYLNNTNNNKNAPNENYAREFLELFTIGKGPQIAEGNYTNYTEADIVQTAKVFTGFKRQANRLNIDATTSLPKGTNTFNQHHTSNKTFSSAFNNTVITAATNNAGMDIELDSYVNMVFGKIATAQNICRKLYIYFVKGTITSEVEQDIIVPLAQELLTNNYELMPTVKKLLTSLHFYDLDDSNALDENIGAIIKSPIQQLSEITTYLQATFPAIESTQFYNNFWNNFAHNTFLAGSNMLLFDPESVAGHFAYYQAPDFDKSWISSATLIARYRLGESLLDGLNRINGNANIFTKINISLVVKNGGIISNALDPNILVKELCDALFAQEPDINRINHFKNQFLLQGLADYNWTDAWNAYLTNNNNSVVEPRLKLLVRKILSSPESQIF
jgi:uncharacterized protein (DUF1800 family)